MAGLEGVQLRLPVGQKLLQGGAVGGFEQHVGALHAGQALHGGGHGGVDGDGGGLGGRLNGGGGVVQKGQRGLQLAAFGAQQG